MTAEQDPHLQTLKVAGILSLVAGLIHSVLVPDHLAEWWGYGVFFMLAAAGQGVFGIRLMAQASSMRDRGQRLIPLKEGDRQFYTLALLGNIGLIVLYVITRTVGIPFLGPAAGTTEPWSAAGVIDKLIEIAIVVYLLKVLRADRAFKTAPKQAAPLEAAARKP